MKIFCISDNVDTAVGLRLAGIEYVVLHEKDKIIQLLEQIVERKQIGIVVVTEKIYQLATEKIKEIEENINIPLIVKIPDRHGS